jgi:hypothetical protein
MKMHDNQLNLIKIDDHNLNFKRFHDNQVETWWKPGGNLVETWWKPGGNLVETRWKPGGNLVEAWWKLRGN